MNFLSAAIRVDVQSGEKKWCLSSVVEHKIANLVVMSSILIGTFFFFGGGSLRGAPACLAVPIPISMKCASTLIFIILVHISNCL